MPAASRTNLFPLCTSCIIWYLTSSDLPQLAVARNGLAGQKDKTWEHGSSVTRQEQELP